MSYNFIFKEPAPRMLIEARKLLGVKEIVGPDHSPTIMGWAEETGINYKADETPWCGLFMAVVAARAGKTIVQSPLWARSWAKWGNAVDVPKLGDVLVFSRESGGHVGLYVGEDKRAFHVLGGNQGNAVSIVRISKSRLIAARNLYEVGQPANCRRIFLTVDGALSENEA